MILDLLPPVGMSLSSSDIWSGSAEKVIVSVVCVVAWNDPLGFLKGRPRGCFDFLLLSRVKAFIKHA